jgi:DNA segregation ATPase FtsK/SpoIIIE, S-DNA-T family
VTTPADRCEECGFVYGSVNDAPGALRGLAERYRQALPADPARRRWPDVWSPLEYACHVRDVLLVQRDRLVVALVEDGPSFAPMYREQRVGITGYATETPGGALAGLEVAADLLARLLERLTPEQLARQCTYNYPEPRLVDVAWVAQHTVHEAEHHLADILLADSGA